MAKDPRSPIKAKPLRNPGQSLDEQIQKLFDEDFMGYYWLAAGAFVLAMTEWIGYLLKAPRAPWIYTVVALALIARAAWKFFPLRAQVRRLKQGRDGERAVGQFLEGLRVNGARIFHDIPGEDFNLDHVVISERGIFVVETKTISKPFTDARVTVEGDEILVAGQKMDRNPLRQVRAQCAWLSRVLLESTGKTHPIRGVVAFPGWFVAPLPKGSPRDVWVLEPKALPAFIEKEPQQLRADEVAMAACHLSRFIRAELAE